MMTIKTFEDSTPKPQYWIGEYTLKDFTDGVLGRQNKPLSPNAWSDTNGTVKAYVNHSRWVIDCPFCRSAAFASKTFRYFWCLECHMERNQGKSLEVIFPDNVSEIEKVLLFRIDPATRNWYPGETLEQLLAENATHGLMGAI